MIDKKRENSKTCSGVMCTVAVCEVFCSVCARGSCVLFPILGPVQWPLARVERYSSNLASVGLHTSLASDSSAAVIIISKHVEDFYSRSCLTVDSSHSSEQ